MRSWDYPNIFLFFVGQNMALMGCDETNGTGLARRTHMVENLQSDVEAVMLNLLPLHQDSQGGRSRRKLQTVLSIYGSW